MLRRRRRRRIIPARAGFTRLAHPGRRRGGDHPRSRGVYSPPPCPTRTIRGSSPLARGLPGPCRARAVGGGIIPARAGFTHPSSHRSLLIGDHPRSRGVYAEENALSASARGSSPLARGLPQTVIGNALGGRIIPARAGFTLVRVSIIPPPRDHPRSRGVYLPLGSHTGLGEGSSPLARGLREA